jgi:subtilisin family serine protease
MAPEGSSPRVQASGPTPDPITAVDRYGGLVDGCDDASAGPDVRRLFVVVDPAGDAEFSLMLCDGLDPKAQLSGSYSWVTRAGDQGENYRRIDVTKNNDNDLTVTVREFNPAVPNVLLNVAGANPRWRMDLTGPAPRLVVLLDADALGLSGNCDPAGSQPCMAMTFSSFHTGSSATDTVPDGNSGSPDISNPHGLFWPSPCGVTTGAPQSAGDSRALLRVTPGQGAGVLAALERAGYPARDEGAGVISVDAGVTDAALTALRALPGVEVARRHARRTQALAPRDPQYGSGGDRQWYLPRIGAPSAWDTTTGSSSVRIGIVDDGIDGTRDDFSGRVGAGYDAVNDAALPAGANSDMGWHGTAVAAVAGATGSTSASATGMAGVDWQATLVPIRVWSHNRCFDEVAYLRGLKWAADSGDLDVINLSLGGPDPIGDISPYPGERTALRRLAQAGTVVVAAAGNNAWIDVPMSYPGALPDVIAVGATGVPASDGQDQLAPYSNRGRYVDIVAPGGAGATPATGILTATDPTVHGAAFGVENGTSFSTPIVSGAAALYRSIHPKATTAEVTRALLSTAEDLGSGMAAFDTSFGFGMLNLPALLAAGSAQTSLTTRTAGNDRYATAAVASEFAFSSPRHVRTVLLATGADFPDALAGGPFAARRHGPILLTLKDGLPQATIDELVRLNPVDVVLLGGPNTISPTVESQLAAVLGYPAVGACGAALADDSRSSCRLAGASRYETAAAIAALGWGESEVVYVATGGNFPDALSGGATAAAFDAPLLLTTPTELPAATRNELARLHPALVVVLGGEASVSGGVGAAIASTPGVGRVIRASGPNRFETAVAALCPDALVCVTDTRYVTIATGAGFADALAGSAVAAALRAPLLLADPNQPGSPTLTDALAVLEPERAVVLGGLNTLPASTESSVAEYVVR